MRQRWPQKQFEANDWGPKILPADIEWHGHKSMTIVGHGAKNLLHIGILQYLEDLKRFLYTHKIGDFAKRCCFLQSGIKDPASHDTLLDLLDYEEQEATCAGGEVSWNSVRSP